MVFFCQIKNVYCTINKYTNILLYFLFDHPRYSSINIAKP